MKTLINAGFGHPLGLPLLTALKARGFSGIRQDMLPTSDIPALLNELVLADLQPVLLIKEPSLVFVRRVGEAIRASGLLHPTRPAPYVEIIGEPDWAWAAAGGQGGAEGWGGFVSDSALVLHSISPRIKVIAGGITTTDRKRLNFLAEAEPEIPYNVIIGFHTYRTTQEPWKAWGGFASRAAEMRWLKDITRGRRLFLTEVGWHTAPSRVGGWLCNALGIGCKTVQYTDAQVAAFAKWEWEFAQAEGVEGLVWYQLNDGPTAHYEDHFGIRRLNRTWKPVAETLRTLTEGR